MGNTILYESRYDPRLGAKCLLDNSAHSPQLSKNELERGIKCELCFPELQLAFSVTLYR